MKNHLLDIKRAFDNGTEYKAKDCLSARGGKLLIQELSAEAHVIYNALGSGLSLQQSTVMVNSYLLGQGQEIDRLYM